MIDENLQKKRYSGLREQAKGLVESGSLKLSELTAEQQESIADLVEELRIYEAELEIQNDTLRITQLQLEASQALYEELFSSLPVAVFVPSGHGVIQQLNLQAMSLFASQRRNRLVNHSIYRLLKESSAQSLAGVISADSLGIQSFDVEIDTSVGVKTFDSYTVRLPSEAENLFSFNYIFMLVDKSVELEKRNQSRLFESIINNSPTLIFALDRENKCILANNKTLNFFGEKNLNEVLGETPESLMENATSHSLFEQSGRIFSSKKAEQNEHVIKINNVSRVLLVNQFPLKNINNETYAISTIATDITSQKQNETKLKLALQIFSQGQEGIIICNARAEIISVNKAFEQITGFNESEVIGQNPKILSSGRHDKQFYKHMWSTILTQGHWEGEVWENEKTARYFLNGLTSARPMMMSQMFQIIWVFLPILLHRKNTLNKSIV
jgi:PAS domain S-box-containing protein